MVFALSQMGLNFSNCALFLGGLSILGWEIEGGGGGGISSDDGCGGGGSAASTHLISRGELYLMRRLDCKHDIAEVESKTTLWARADKCH